MRSLFISDLFIQPGQHKTVSSEDLSTDMVELYRVCGIFATEEPIRKTVQKLVKLNPKLLCPCMVPLLIARCFQYIDAIMNESYAYPNRLLGKEIEEKSKGNEL